MILENEKEILLWFLKEYPEASWRQAETMYDGYVTLIKPIPTICGAEFQCTYKTYQSVLELKRGEL